MAKVVDMKGVPRIEINGTPWKQQIKQFAAFHEELAKAMSHDDYLCIETKVGTIEFHFKE